MSGKTQCRATTVSTRQCLKSVSVKDPQHLFCQIHMGRPDVKLYEGPAKQYRRSTSALPKVRQEHYEFCHSMVKDQPKCKENKDVCTWTRNNCQRAFGKKHTLAALQRWAPEGQSSRWEDASKY